MRFSSNFIIVYTTFMRTAVDLNELPVCFLGSLFVFCFVFRGLRDFLPLFLHDSGKYMTWPRLNLIPCEPTTLLHPERSTALMPCYWGFSALQHVKSTKKCGWRLYAYLNGFGQNEMQCGPGIMLVVQSGYARLHMFTLYWTCQQPFILFAVSYFYFSVIQGE